MSFSRWLRGSAQTERSKKGRSSKKSRATRNRCRGWIEPLESRAMLSATSLSELACVYATPAATSSGYTATQITSAYLASNLSLITTLKGTITGDGSGQTIAIVDAYNDPKIASDLATFSTTFGLYYDSSLLKVVSQTGSTTSLPTTDADWGVEIALDVEWAHAVAPKANILLVEASSSSLADLLTAVKYAASYTGVSVVSMSWGCDEFRGETSYDSYFTTSSGHTGVTFIAASGDDGTTCWPSVSSSVLAVGGTTLTVNSSGTYVSETAWSSSGGGISSYVALPSYQKMIGISASGRVTPDVAYDANSSTGFLVYDSLAVDGSTGWMTVGGTSAGAPQWAAILAIANQGRIANGLNTLTQANAMLYTLYATKSSADFHDVTSGRNTDGYNAAKGYDAVTGMGSPIVSALVADLAKATATSTKTSSTTVVIRKGSSGSTGGWGGGWGGGGWGGGWGGGGWGGGWGGGSGRGWGGGWTSGWGGGFNRMGMAAVVGTNVAPMAFHDLGHDDIGSSMTMVGLGVAATDVAAGQSAAKPTLTVSESRQFTAVHFGGGQTADAGETTSFLFHAADRLSSEENLQTEPLVIVHPQLVDRLLEHSADEVVALPVAEDEADLGDAAAVRAVAVTEKTATAGSHSAAELHASVAAALVFAWQMRTASQESERDRRRTVAIPRR